MTELTDVDRAMLDLAFTRYKYAGRFEADVRDRWGISSVKFWMRVDWLLEQPEALAYDAVNVRRMLRLRSARRRARTAR